MNVVKGCSFIIKMTNLINSNQKLCKEFILGNSDNIVKHKTFRLLSGNVELQPRKSVYHHDEAVAVRNQDVVLIVSQLLRVKQETLLAALTAKRARASGETLIINYRLPEVL